MQVAKAARCRGVTLAMAALYQCQEKQWVNYKDTRSEFWVRFGKTTDKIGKNWKKPTITGKWVATPPPYLQNAGFGATGKAARKAAWRYEFPCTRHRNK